MLNMINFLLLVFPFSFKYSLYLSSQKNMENFNKSLPYQRQNRFSLFCIIVGRVFCALMTFKIDIIDNCSLWVGDYPEPRVYIIPLFFPFPGIPRIHCYWITPQTTRGERGGGGCYPLDCFFVILKRGFTLCLSNFQRLFIHLLLKFWYENYVSIILDVAMSMS